MEYSSINVQCAQGVQRVLKKFLIKIKMGGGGPFQIISHQVPSGEGFLLQNVTLPRSAEVVERFPPFLLLISIRNFFCDTLSMRIKTELIFIVLLQSNIENVK